MHTPTKNTPTKQQHTPTKKKKKKEENNCITMLPEDHHQMWPVLTKGSLSRRGPIWATGKSLRYNNHDILHPAQLQLTRNVFDRLKTQVWFKHLQQTAPYVLTVPMSRKCPQSTQGPSCQGESQISNNRTLPEPFLTKKKDKKETDFFGRLHSLSFFAVDVNLKCQHPLVVFYKATFICSIFREKTPTYL